ncbi:MAG: exo-alpha-sialidase, partial [Chloroflexi bacterium]|nr:exo-alpha-sialidase [Chloroflexota bacterium]
MLYVNLTLVASPDGSRLLAAWYEAADGGRLWHGAMEQPFFIRASASSDGGRSWSAPADLSAGNEHAETGRLAISTDGQQLTVTWHQATYSHRNEDPNASAWTSRMLCVVQVASSPDGGATWDVTRDLPEAGQRDVPYHRLAASADGQRLAVVWNQFDVSARGRVQGTFSSDGGQNWSGPIGLSGAAYAARG